MRTAVAVSALILVVLPGPVEVAAQAAPSGARPLVPVWTQEQLAAVAPAPTLTRRVLTGLAGAALGAGAGFFASQVGQSDWEEVPGRHEANRGLWAALGGGAGFVAGFSFPLSATGGPPRSRGMSGGRSVITEAELRGTSADNAYDVVRLLRPEWLKTRPPDQLGEVQNETVTVYRDDFREGGVGALRRFHVQNIASIRFIPPAVAVSRWGTGHVMGVIQVIQRPDPPS